MSLRRQEHLVSERLRLLEMEAGLQRAELNSTFSGWEKRKTLAWGGVLATWGVKLFAQPRIRWLIASTLMAQLRRRATR
jgi:hypothetical protein